MSEIHEIQKRRPNWQKQQWINFAGLQSDSLRKAKIEIERLTAKVSVNHLLMNEAADDLVEWVESYGNGFNDKLTKDLIKHLRESAVSGTQVEALDEDKK